MTEHSGIVKGIFPKQLKNGVSFWEVVWNDNSKDNIFKSEWMELIKKSQTENRILNFTREPTPDGKFKNIKSVAFATLPVKPPIAPQSLKIEQLTALPPSAGTGQPTKSDMTKEDWEAREKTTRKSIERQTALNAAVELAKIKPDKASSENIILTAKYFENYLAGEEVQPAIKVRMVEAAKKLGAEEIKKGGDVTP